MRAFRRIFLISLSAILLPSIALACEHCLGTGGANGPTIRALIFSMATLLLMIGGVGVGIGAFFVNSARRSRNMDSQGGDSGSSTQSQ